MIHKAYTYRVAQKQPTKLHPFNLRHDFHAHKYKISIEKAYTSRLVQANCHIVLSRKQPFFSASKLNFIAQLSRSGVSKKFLKLNIQSPFNSIYTVSQKRDPNIIDCNFKKDQRILTIFCTNIPDTAGHQMAIQFPTSPNVCFYTTWGKQNKRNMHWNEQQTSRNWRLDRIKFWSQRSELM